MIMTLVNVLDVLVLLMALAVAFGVVQRIAYLILKFQDRRPGWISNLAFFAYLPVILFVVLCEWLAERAAGQA